MYNIIVKYFKILGIMFKIKFFRILDLYVKLLFGRLFFFISKSV